MAQCKHQFQDVETLIVLNGAVGEIHTCVDCGQTMMVRYEAAGVPGGWKVLYAATENNGLFEVAETMTEAELDELDKIVNNGEETDWSDMAEAEKIMGALGAENPYLALIILDKFYMQAQAEEKGVKAVNEVLVREVDNTSGILRFYRAQVGEIAANLAHLGDLSHKEKNEGILRAVARLIDLAAANNPARDTDELPW